MDDIRISFLGLFIVNLVVGFLLGTFPLVAGLIAGNRKHGFLGFVLSIVGGGLLGVFLSYPLAMLFLWMIAKRRAVGTREPGATGSIEAEA